MNVAVLHSTHPDWCAKIINGRKKMELKKSFPKTEGPFKAYIYCTNDRKMKLWKASTYAYIDDHSHNAFDVCLNGKVIGEYLCDNVLRHCEMANADIAEQQSCVKREKIYEYSKGGEVFGWNFTNLVIYDKPKELSEFKGRKLTWRGNNHVHVYEELKRPPQSWCFVQELV